MTRAGEAVLERFVEITNAALLEVGHGPLMFPSFLDDEGIPYIQFDTWDVGEGSPEFNHLIKAETIALFALGFSHHTHSSRSDR